MTVLGIVCTAAETSKSLSPVPGCVFTYLIQIIGKPKLGPSAHPSFSKTF